MKKIIVLLSLFLIIFSGCGSNSGLSYRVGDTVTLKESAYICISKDDEDDMLKYMNAKDEDSINQMIADGKILNVSEGETLKIEDFSGASADVKIASGDYNGDEGYIPSDTLNKLIQ
ncbi:hypothetical protein AGR56_13875 [Clostridium sp. DMHC 10]|uniref:hypothetical protein n=1 Tax=Clostridium sp. DMHC 10 TaxID=747377 RepID=UPI00069DF96C|nr:hypothetical protein [Clostridium sp. DMHC 10]KOF57467.1 hypothetical protein AGR56_13875 [Clostridium sp. DMHC 10]